MLPRPKVQQLLRHQKFDSSFGSNVGSLQQFWGTQTDSGGIDLNSKWTSVDASRTGPKLTLNQLVRRRRDGSPMAVWPEWLPLH